MADIPPSTTDTRASQLIHFRDARPPHEIQFLLERELMELFEEVRDAPTFTLRTSMKWGTLRFHFDLCLLAALPRTNCYSLAVTLTYPDRPDGDNTDLNRTLESWVGLWTRDFTCATPPSPNEGSPTLYQQLVDQARAAEAHLGDIPAIQQEILRRMRAGATYHTAHKEGGTDINYWNGKWRCVDYGDWSSRKQFSDANKFLAYLREFFDAETSRNVAPDTVSDEKAWRLILRLLQPAGGTGSGWRGGNNTTQFVVMAWGMVVSAAVIVVMLHLRAILSGHTRATWITTLFVPSLGVLAVSALVAAIWLRKNWE